MQAVIHSAILAPESRPENINWWLALSTLQLDRGLSHVWTPYPPLFPVIHAGVTKLVAGQEQPMLRRWFFEGDRSSEASAAHERVLARLQGIWLASNVALIAAIAGVVFVIVRRTRGSLVAGMAVAAFALSGIAPESRVRIGFTNDQFDYLPALLLIGSIALVGRRHLTSAALAAAGILAKLFPFVALTVASARAKHWRAAAVPIACALGVVGLGVAPFAISDPPSFLSTWRFSGERGGWESIWLFPERRWPPMPRARAMPALFGQPLPTAQLVLQDGRRVSGIVSAKDLDSITFLTAGHEERIPRSSIAAVGERQKPALFLRLLAVAALLLAAATPFAIRRSLDTPDGVVRAALLSVTVLLFFSPGVSSYYFLWAVPLMFATLMPERAMALTVALVLAANFELLGAPDFPYYWWAIGVRQLIWGVLGLMLLFRLRRESRKAAP